MSHDRPQKITLSEMHTFGVRSFTSSVHAADGDRADALEWLDKRAVAYQALQDMG